MSAQPRPARRPCGQRQPGPARLRARSHGYLRRSGEADLVPAAQRSGRPAAQRTGKRCQQPGGAAPGRENAQRRGTVTVSVRLAGRGPSTWTQKMGLPAGRYGYPYRLAAWGLPGQLAVPALGYHEMAAGQDRVARRPGCGSQPYGHGVRSRGENPCQARRHRRGAEVGDPGHAGGHQDQRSRHRKSDEPRREPLRWERRPAGTGIGRAPGTGHGGRPPAVTGHSGTCRRGPPSGA